MRSGNPGQRPQLGHAGGDERLLVLPHQPRRVAFNGKRSWRRERDRAREFSEDVQSHGVARRLVQDQGEAIELHHLMEPAGQLVEQHGQIVVQDDRFRNSEQGSIPVASGSCLPIEGRAFHGKNLGQSLRTWCETTSVGWTSESVWFQGTDSEVHLTNREVISHQVLIRNYLVGNPLLVSKSPAQSTFYHFSAGQVRPAAGSLASSSMFSGSV